MRLYSGGFPMLDTGTAQIPGAIDTLVNVGGGGGGMDQATGDSVAGFDPGVTPGPSGFIGLDPDMDIDPQDFAQEDYGIYDPTATTGGITGDPIDVGIPDNESGFVDPLGTMSGAPVVGDFSEPTTGTISDDRLNEVIGGQPMAAGPFDYLQEQTPLSQVQVPGLDYSQAAIDAERLAGYTPSFGTLNEVTEDPTMQETISNAFTSARQGIGDLATASVDKIQEVGQSIANTIGGIYNGVDQTISVFGREINVPATLAGIAASQVVGAPINIAFGLAKAIGGALPQSDPINAAVKTGLSDKGYEFDDLGRLTTGPMAGYSTVSLFGKDIAKATIDAIDYIENRTAPQTAASIAKTQDYYDFLSDVTEVKAAATAPQEDIGAIPGDINTGVAPDGTLPDGTNIMDEFKNNDIQPTDPTLDIPDRGRGDPPSGPPSGPGITADDAFANDGPSNVGGPPSGPGATADEGFETNDSSGNGNGGNGNGGGGGTHICTASYANNLITILDFKSLKKYGIKLRRNDKYLMKAYDWFGPKLAAAVKKGKLVNFAKHSTSMWKYEQTKEDVSFKIKFMSRLHKIITRPILRALGALLTIKEKLTK